MRASDRLPARLSEAASWAQETARDVVALARLTRDLPRVVQAPLTQQQARERVRRRLDRRAQRLLTLVEQGVYGLPRSPYLKLLQLAGCEPGDFQRLVIREGVEDALRVLAGQGVYVTYEEMKGRREVVRGSQRLTFEARDFDNPLVRPHFVVQTSGSGGRPSRIRYPLAFIDEWAADMALLFEAHSLHAPRHAYWWPVPLAWLLVCARLRQPVIGWFYPVRPLPAVASWGARYLALLGRLAGQRFPTPRPCDLHQPQQMVAWLLEQLADSSPLVLWTSPSSAVRLAAAATASGQSLRGLTLLIGGEPVTEARRRHIEASGAAVMVMYTCAEAGGLSYSCAAPIAPDDVHLLEDRYAVIQRQRPVSDGGPMVDALLVTSLSPHVARITLNTETGDTGRIAVRECECLLGALGFRTHLSDVQSFEKLTGEGVTFARSNLSLILEDLLPARFGGTALDYQLAEEMMPDGITRLVLRVSPSVGPIDEAELAHTLLAQLGGDGLSAKYQADLWQHAGTLDIRRELPLATRAGKVLPFSSARTAARS